VVEQRHPSEPAEQTSAIPAARDSAESTPAGAAGYIDRQEPRQPADEAAQHVRRHWRWRTILLGAILAVGVLCITSLITGYFVYDNATKPDRSTPELATRHYLEAVFTDRDQAKAKLFSCDARTDNGEVEGLLAQVKEREQRFNVAVVVRWEGFTSAISERSAFVDVTLRVLVPEANGSTSEAIQLWQFAVRNGSGWQVCGSHRKS
jgi:hypothetical protein